ncbi:hypothetical protein P3S67_013879 [Capsicum chacoense]
MWNENYNEWVQLRNLVVTTHNKDVARIMRAEQISMDTLSIDDSWSLFERHAFENMDPREHPELKEVAKQIAAKCKGLPLALKTVAVILCSESEIEGWRRILRSEIWKLPNNDILPALMLSYNELPPHLKPCFSFCAIFPKDYPFRKEQVIHLWIANGFVEQQGDERIQDLGNQYFDDLRSRSLFERVPKSSERYGGKFLMHDLVNDLAQNASSKLCVRLEDCQGSHLLEQSRHLSYSMGEGGDFMKLNLLSKSGQLRTLLPIEIQRLFHPRLSKRVLHNILPSLRSLRALSLSDYGIVELPNDLFIKLKLLRFLDLSRTQMMSLSIEDCKKLKQLPELLPSLKELPLYACPVIESFPDGGLPFNLQILDIRRCEKLVNEIVDGENWELPCSIRRLFIGNLKALSSQVLNSLTSLESLQTFNLLQVQSLLEEGLPSSLSELYLWDHDELHSLLTEGLRHLTSLQSLDISRCHLLQSLPQSALPSSLTEQTIWKCPNLQSLPVKGMPSSLSKIDECPLVEPLVKFDKGEYWPKIAHIPEIYTRVSIG